MTESKKLSRQLGFWDSVAISIGVVIGVGIFRTPSEIAKYLSDPNIILIAWILGGLISLVGVLCYAELSSCFPETGGTYVYLREAYGKVVAFLFGWMEFSVLRAGSLAGISYVLAAYLRNFVDLGPNSEQWVAISAIWIFTFVNMLGLHYGTGVQNVMSSLKVLTLVLIIVILFGTQSDMKTPVLIASESSGSGWRYLAPALIPILWSYGGWNESTFMSGEFKDTKRELPLSLITSIFIITALYVFVNAAYLKMMTPAQMVESDSLAADIFKHLFQGTGHILMSAAVMISAMGALNSYILTGARIPFAVAQDTQKLAALGTVHAKFGTPTRSFLLNALWASILILWGTFEDLIFFTGFAKWLFFALAGGSVFILRKKQRDQHATFKMIGYPLVPILFILVSLILLWTTLAHAPRAALFGAFLLLLGVPVYFFLQRGKQ